MVVLAVGLDAAAKDSSGELNRAAAVAIQRSGKLESIRLVDALEPQNSAKRKAKLAEAEAAYLAGISAYDELDTVRAAQQFEASMKAFRSTDLTRTLEELAKAWVMKAASFVANGENAAAKQEIEKIVAVHAKAQFSSAYFTPDALKQVEEARKSAAAAKGELKVKTTPSGAEVYLDGEYRGVSPLTVKKLLPGEHLLTALAAGYSMAQQPVGLGTAEVSLRPAEAHEQWRAAVERIAQDPRGPLRDAAAKELGKWVGADQVLLAIAKKSSAGHKLELTALRLETKDGHNAAYQIATVPMGQGLGPAAETLFMALLSKDEPRQGGNPVVHFDLPGSGTLRRTVGYALIATGVALVGGGLFIGTQANAQVDEYRRTKQTDAQRSAELKNRGQTYALMADLFMLGGVVAAAPGGFLAFSGSERKEELGQAPEAKGLPGTDARGKEARGKDARAKEAAAELERRREEQRKKEEEGQQKKEQEKNKRDEEDLRNF